MTTIKISIKNKRDATLLFRMLKKMSFIDKIEKTDSLVSKEAGNQFLILSKVLKDKANPDLFNKLGDPVKWQKTLRDEWE